MLAALVGVVTGFVVAAFDRLVVDASFDHILELDPILIAAIPGVGLLVSLAIRRYIGASATPSTADEYLRSFHEPSNTLSTRDFVARMLAAIATLGSGGPMGLEGPSLYAGAFVGLRLQRRMPRIFRDADERVLLVAGAAAGVAAIFKAPATGAVFALEVPYHDDLARRMLLPALVSSATGYLAFASVNGTASLFSITGGAGFGFHDLAGAVAIGVIAGIGARGFSWLIRLAKRVQHNRHALITTVAGGVVIAGLFAVGRFLTGQSLLVGPGYDVVLGRRTRGGRFGFCWQCSPCDRWRRRRSSPQVALGVSSCRWSWPAPSPVQRSARWSTRGR
jgi:chloride channel protein, CIC family